MTGDDYRTNENGHYYVGDGVWADQDPCEGWDDDVRLFDDDGEMLDDDEDDDEDGDDAEADDPTSDPTEPSEGDYITTDDASCSTMHFREYGTGKPLLAARPDDSDWRKTVRAHMDRRQFWPNVWFCSDHGNWHLMSLGDDE